MQSFSWIHKFGRSNILCLALICVRWNMEKHIWHDVHFNLAKLYQVIIFHQSRFSWNNGIYQAVWGCYTLTKFQCPGPPVWGIQAQPRTAATCVMATGRRSSSTCEGEMPPATKQASANQKSRSLQITKQQEVATFDVSEILHHLACIKPCK